MSDGRIRYYGKKAPSLKPGQTRGSSFVTEYDPKTGQVKSWMECYDQNGKINRVHPKTNNGQVLEGQHYPPTKSELELMNKGSK